MEVEKAEQLLKESIMDDLDQAILLARNLDANDIVDILIGVERKLK